MTRKFLKTKNSNGFSLVELMIVVAIIGILAAVGVPQFAKFQAKSRQVEIKRNLAALFINERTFHTEYNHYTVDLSNVGFGLLGRGLRYDLGFAGAASCGATYAAQAAMTGAPIENPALVLASALPAGTGLTLDWMFGIPTPIAGGVICTATTFTAIGFGNPNSSATATNSDDQWSMDQNKRIRHVVNGIL